ncbi:RNA polymerase III-inhibiting protein maf1, partial [Coelomomyces lativittatus]
MPKFMELTCVERVNTLLDGFRTGDAYLYARIERYSLKYTVSEKKLYRQLDQCYKITPTQLQESSLFPSIPLSSAPSASLSSSSVPSVFKPSRPSLTSFSTTNLIRKRRLTFPSHKRHMLDSRSPSTSGVKPRSFESTSFSPESILCKRQRVGHYAKRLSFDELAKESGSRKILFYLIAILNASFPDYDFTDVPPFSFKRGNLEDLTSILESPIFALNDESKACAQDDLWDALNDACDQKLHESLV